VVIYVIDTLRADALGAYGNALPVSPHFDRLADSGILFERAFAASSWTRPTVVSILTGLMPIRHGVNQRNDRLADEARTLAEILRDAGYRTGGFITNANVGAEFGVDQGFDVYEWYPHGKDEPDVAPRSSVLATESALRWIAAGDSDQPFFALVHLSDPHGPYTPPKLERARFASDVERSRVGAGPFLRELAELKIELSEALRQDLIRLYLAEVAYTDARLGDFLAGLETSGHADDTLVVVVADHGEEFFEHGWSEHGKTLYSEQVHVPLVMRLPHGKLAGRRFSAPVRQIDLLPTILDVVDIDRPQFVDGQSVLEPLVLRALPDTGPILAFLDLDGRRLESVTVGDLKLIDTFEYMHPADHHPGVQLFDLAKDPGEQVNLAEQRPILAGYLRTLGRAERLAATQALVSETAVIDDEIENELRALGYLE
jgi:arylsulfatase A-like enzyme